MKVLYEQDRFLILEINEDYVLVAFENEGHKDEGGLLVIATKKDVRFMYWLAERKKPVMLMITYGCGAPWQRRGSEIFWDNGTDYVPMTKETCEDMIKKSPGGKPVEIRGFETTYKVEE